ncbi:MAG: hypothetical protein OXE42_01880 [Gammaproteobacteria bacterium]|nr:hypothetical protein [Gammaproteobacteria bacterium]
MKISDHAVLRYLERFKGIDVEETRRSLARVMDTPRMNDVIEFAGQARCKVKKADGIFCVQDGTLTTCYPSN